MFALLAASIAEETLVSAAGAEVEAVCGSTYTQHRRNQPLQRDRLDRQSFRKTHPLCRGAIHSEAARCIPKQHLCCLSPCSHTSWPLGAGLAQRSCHPPTHCSCGMGALRRPVVRAPRFSTNVLTSERRTESWVSERERRERERERRIGKRNTFYKKREFTSSLFIPPILP